MSFREVAQAATAGLQGDFLTATAALEQLNDMILQSGGGEGGTSLVRVPELVPLLTKLLSVGVATPEVRRPWPLSPLPPSLRLPRVPLFTSPDPRVAAQATAMAQLTVRAIVHLLDLEPGCCSHFVSEGLLPALSSCLRRGVTDMEVAEQCIKW